jgi:hypothetical protein
MSDTRKLHFKEILDAADQHIGREGDVWFDPESTTLRTYDNGTMGGKLLGGSGYNSNEFIDYGSHTGADTNIDLTRKYHWLVDLGDGHHYNLLDGVDGQELIFFPCQGLDYQGVEQSDVYVNNMKYWDDGRPSWWTGSRIIRIFGHADAVNMVAQVSAVWMNGAWHFSAGPADLGNQP